MKYSKGFLFAFLLILVIAIVYNYPKLNLISGYASKNLASTNFISKRTHNDITKNDNNVPLIKLARLENATKNSAIASVYGLMDRETICRDGLGCILITDDYNKNQKLLKPNRTKIANKLPFPYGNNGIKDTIFKTIDYTKLSKAVDIAFLNNDVQKTRTVLIAYKGHIIAEKYIKGFSKDTPILGWSMTKSVLATLFGILEYQNKINIFKDHPFSKENETNDLKESITLNHLLRMQSGLEWNEDYSSISDVTKMLFLDKNMSLTQANKKSIAKPEVIWNYSSGTSNLLSGLLRKQFKTYQQYLDFPYQALIDKIGMHSMLIETDMAGNFVGSSYAWATTRDWAKLGILHLKNGNWNGEQLFSPKWIKYITKPTAGSKQKYGAHWWLNAGGKYPNVPRDLYSANGYQGQRLFIIPSKDLVIVRTGLVGDSGFNANEFLKNVLAAIN